MNHNPFGFLIFILLTLWFSVYCWVENREKSTNFTENQPVKTIPIGYDFDKVGKDSVLVIQGKFVREFGGRVYVKVN